MWRLCWLIAQQVGQVSPANRPVGMVGQPPRVDRREIGEDTHRDRIGAALARPTASRSVHTAEQVGAAELGAIDTRWIGRRRPALEWRLGKVGRGREGRLLGVERIQRDEDPGLVTLGREYA